jgi:hypothetical protein
VNANEALILLARRAGSDDVETERAVAVLRDVVSAGYVAAGPQPWFRPRRPGPKDALRFALSGEGR